MPPLTPREIVAALAAFAVEAVGFAGKSSVATGGGAVDRFDRFGGWNPRSTPSLPRLETRRIADDRFVLLPEVCDPNRDRRR